MDSKEIIRLESLTEAAKRLAETKRSLLLDMLNPAFIAKHSNSPDFITLCESAGYDINTIEDFDSVADEQWDRFIAENTDFADWSDMQAGAVAAHASEQLLKVIKN